MTQDATASNQVVSHNEQWERKAQRTLAPLALKSARTLQGTKQIRVTIVILPGEERKIQFKLS